MDKFNHKKASNAPPELDIINSSYLTIPHKKQSDSLKHYTSQGWVSKNFLGQVHHQLVKKYFKKYHINQEFNDSLINQYTQYFYIHLSQDLRAYNSFYQLSPLDSNYNIDAEDPNTIYYYILGFEIIKMFFQMSWLQHERLYGLQKNQDSFIQTYIKPIQNAHRINGIIVPKYEKIFFAKRNYFVKKPQLKGKKLHELVIATFSANTVTNLGFLIIRHLNFLVFDYEYIYSDEPESIFFL
jgi:hypothetical protein